MTVRSSKAVVKRIDFGYFVRPASETPTGRPRVEAVLGYAIVHPQGVLLFDTGMGEGDPEVEVHYRPVSLSGAFSRGVVVPSEQRRAQSRSARTASPLNAGPWSAP